MDVKEVAKLHVELCKVLFAWHLKNNDNTDKVAVLFGNFPSRKICIANQPTAYTSVKDRLAVVLSLTADGKKLPSVII